MTTQISLDQLTHEIRRIYEPDNPHAEALIEAYLKEKLKAIPSEKRLTLLEGLTNNFGRANPELSDGVNVNMEQESLSKLLTFLLGKKVAPEDLTSTELLQNLAESLNTVFDSLNKLIGVISATLCPGSNEVGTIRMIIGDQLKGERQSRTLEGYLGQIEKAFLISQKAFREAVYKKLNDILRELDPEQMEDIGGSGLDFGPFHRAKLFTIYRDKFRTFRNWVESGPFLNEFEKEFENQCWKLSRRLDR